MEKITGYAEVNETRLYYESTGSGAVLVLIHGFGLDCRQWRDQVEFFAPHYNVICYDLRGFGRSAVPSDLSYSHAEDLRALLVHLGITKAHILGHSFGGRVSIAFAIMYPGMTLSMIAADPALEGFNSEDPETIELMNSITEVWATGFELGVDAARDLWFKFSPMELAMNIPDVAEPMIKMIDDYSGWHWINDDNYQPLDPPAIEQLEKISSPTLIMIGELNQSIYHFVGDVMIDKIPNSTREIVTGTAHMLNMEDADQFNTKLFKFLQEISNS